MQNEVSRIWNHVKALQRIVTSAVKLNRGGKFNVDHWIPIIEEKKKINASENESLEIIDLYKLASQLHFNIIRKMTHTIRPNDEPWTENLQTEPVIELFYEIDPEFYKSVHKLVEGIEDADWLIDRAILGRYSGMYGPTWVNDYLPTPGSSMNLYKAILDKIKINSPYHEIILTAITSARNTSYCNLLGATFAKAFEEGKPWKVSAQAEKQALKRMWLEPVDFQVELMQKLNFQSFDVSNYLSQFKQGIRKSVEKCMNKGIHPANILRVINAAGAIEHHISQMAYNMCKDDLIMAVFEVVADVLEKTMDRAVSQGKLKDPFFVPVVSITAAAVACILREDGFTANMVNNLLFARSNNLYLRNPDRLQREDLVSVFMNYLATGERVIEDAPRGTGGMVGDIEVDLSPIGRNQILQNPQWYTWGQTPITARFSAIIRFADEPMMLMSDPAIIAWNVFLIALKPEACLDSDICRSCVEAIYLPERCRYCLAKRQSKERQNSLFFSSL